MAAWRIVPRGAIVRLVDTVRNKVLNFALEIEELNPAAGDVQPSEVPVSPSIVHHLVQTNIYGTVGNVAAGSSNVAQNSVVQIAAGDLPALKREMQKLGLPNEEIEHLEVALLEDAKAGEKGIGSRAKSWLGNVLGKAVSGAWKISLDTAGTVLPKLIAQHLGLPM